MPKGRLIEPAYRPQAEAMARTIEREAARTVLFSSKGQRLDARPIVALRHDIANLAQMHPSGDLHDMIVQRSKENRARFDAFKASEWGQIVMKEAVPAGVRMDAIGGGVYGGWAMPYDLVQIRGQVLEQPLPPLNAESCFSINGETANGMQNFATRRTNARVMAKFSGSGAVDVSQSSINQVELLSNVRYASAGYKISIQDLASAEAGNFMLQQRLTGGALRALQNTANYTVWFGNKTEQLWGVTANHPLMPYSHLPAFTAAAYASSSAVAVQWFAYMAQSVDNILNDNFNTFAGDSIAISSKLKTFLQRYFITVGGTAVTKTVWAAFLDHCEESGIDIKKDIHVTQELSDLVSPLDGTTVVQGMFVYNRYKDGGVNAQIIKVPGPVALPVQFVNMEMQQLYYQGIGGFRSENPGACNMVFVQVVP